MTSLSLVAGRARLIVETIRDSREARIPRIAIVMPSDIRIGTVKGDWCAAAIVSRVQSAVELLSSEIRDGAPWRVVRAWKWAPRERHPCIELHTFAGTDAEADLGLRLLERLAAEVERQAAAA